MFQPTVTVPTELLQHHNALFTREAWRTGHRPDQRRAIQPRPLTVEFTRGPMVKRISTNTVGGGDEKAQGSVSEGLDESSIASRSSVTRVEVKLGATHIVASLHCFFVEPSPQQPKHGFFDIHVRCLTNERTSSSTGTPSGDLHGNPNIFPSSLVQLRRFLLSLFKGGVIDTEGLCVVPGKHAWSLTVDCAIVHNDGNVLDGCQLAVLSLLLAHRRPEVLILAQHEQTIPGESVRLFEEWERDPAPLSLLQTPLSCSFALTVDPQQQMLARRKHQLQQAHHTNSSSPAPILEEWELIVDPSLEEATAAASSITVVVNREGQVSATVKGGGPSVSLSHVAQCMALAGGSSDGVIKQDGEDSSVSQGGVTAYWGSVIDSAVKKLEVERQNARKTQFLWAKQRTGVASTAKEGVAPVSEEPNKKKPKTE